MNGEVSFNLVHVEWGIVFRKDFNGFFTVVEIQYLVNRGFAKDVVGLIDKVFQFVIVHV